MATDQPARRPVYVVALDGALVQALAQHRPAAAGWRLAILDGPPPEPDALIIVDLHGEEERRNCVQALRGAGFAGPLLILGDTGPGEAPEDEPVGRPVRLGLLLDRIDAHVAEPGESQSYRLGPYVFDASERELRPAAGGPIRLTELERKLLACLAEADGAIVGRDALLARVWGYSAGVATHTVGTHVWRLRQKIETGDPATRFLVTEAGGYRLVLAPADGSD